MNATLQLRPGVREAVRRTTILEPARLSKLLGMNLILASETFQLTGSFKFRAAYNVAASISHPAVITASSGNFGQAMAYACSLTGKACTVVMPATSARVKIDAVREYGGVVDLLDVQRKSRAARVQELAAGHPEAYVASAYDDPLVIDGNASLGLELAALEKPIDCVIAPVGGGGLTAGLVRGLSAGGRAVPIFGAEPAIANDVARSFQAGYIIANESEPRTIADGARTVSVGQHNWPILRHGLTAILEVSEERIAEAVRILFSLANLKCEPTGALAVGALLENPARFRGSSVCCVISGGNVDPSVYCSIVG
jgi:threonine dehydratase